MLVEESSLPLQAIESDFAVDSSGFSTCRFVQWVNAKYTTPQLMTKREWVKVHLMCGVKTNIVTAVEITDRYAADSPQFKQLSRHDCSEFRHAGSLSRQSLLVSCEPANRDRPCRDALYPVQVEQRI